MGTAAKPTRENRTIAVDVRDEATYFRLIADGQAFLACVLAFVLSLGFQLKHKATCGGGGCLTRHSHDVRRRLRVSPKSLLCRIPVAERPIDVGGFKSLEHKVNCTYPYHGLA
jgi:hypothetical protein